MSTRFDTKTVVHSHSNMRSMSIALIQRTRIGYWSIRTSEVVADEVKPANDLEARPDPSTKRGMCEVDTSVNTRGVRMLVCDLASAAL